MSETTEKPKVEIEETPPGVSETFFNKMVGINEAAEISRASKGQLSKDSNGGRIAFTLSDKGHKQYKVSDLYQKYGFRNQPAPAPEEPQKPEDTQSETMQRAIELAVLKERVSRLEDENRDLRQNRDKLFEQNNRLTMLLTAPPAAPPAPTAQASPTPTPTLTAWQRTWRRWFGAKETTG